MPESTEQDMKLASPEDRSTAPDAGLPPVPPEKKGSKTAKVLIGAVLAVALAVGLYFLNNRWIAPATSHEVKAADNHPLAPEFSLTDINGQKLDLSDYKGKVVVLDFWATWCGPCRIEIPHFVTMQDRYRGQGLAIIGISMDDGPEPVREFYNQFRMNYPVAIGNDKLAALYGGILGLPTTFVIGRDGRIYSKHTGATSGAVFENEIQELLAVNGGAEAPNFKAAGMTEDVEVSTPEAVKAESNPEVPGVDISKLSPEQLKQYEKLLQQQKCTCGGCQFNLLQCRRQDSTCAVSRKLAKEELKKFLEPKA